MNEGLLIILTIIAIITFWYLMEWLFGKKYLTQPCRHKWKREIANDQEYTYCIACHKTPKEAGVIVTWHRRKRRKGRGRKRKRRRR